MKTKQKNDIWAVKMCKNRNCPAKVWQRDVNACLNIGYIFKYMEDNNGNRPTLFTVEHQRQIRRDPYIVEASADDDDDDDDDDHECVL